MMIRTSISPYTYRRASLLVLLVLVVVSFLGCTVRAQSTSSSSSNVTVPEDGSFVSIADAGKNQTLIDAASKAYNDLMTLSGTNAPAYKFLPLDKGDTVEVVDASTAPGGFYQILVGLYVVQGKRVTCKGAFHVYFYYDNAFLIVKWGKEVECSDNQVQAAKPQPASDAAVPFNFSRLVATLIVSLIFLV